MPVPIMHGARVILGYRLASFAYLTDCSGIPETSYALLAGVELLVIGALRDTAASVAFHRGGSDCRRDPHWRVAGHFTHMNHDLGHVATCARLPAVQLAYDGLVVQTA